MNDSAQTERLAGRTALITGASRGLGAAIAYGFAREGAQVIALARNADKLEALDDAIQQETGKTITLLPFDLANTKAIDQIGPSIAERFGVLDILVGNAGLLGSLSPLAQADPQTVKNVFAVNTLANIHLIRTLDPLLRASDAGRAIFVTSGAAQMHKPYWSLYSASKAALESFVLTYAAEVAYSKLKVNLVDPGVLRTDMRAQAFPGEDPLELPDAQSIVPHFIDLAAPDCDVTARIVETAA